MACDPGYEQCDEYAAYIAQLRSIGEALALRIEDQELRERTLRAEIDRLREDFDARMQKALVVNESRLDQISMLRGLLAEAKLDMRIAAKCMHPLAPIFRQLNDTADRIDAAINGEKL